MKKFSFLALALLALGGFATVAFAIKTETRKPGQVLYADGAVVQNMTAIAPLKGYVRTGSTAVNKGRAIFSFNTYTSASWFRKAEACVTNSTGVAQPVRYAVGNNTPAMIAPSGCFSLAVNHEYTAVSVVPFSNASSASQTTYYWSHQRE